MIHKDIDAAEQRYDGNGWSEVEKLVLYRIDACEEGIGIVKDDLKALVEKREADVEKSRKQRTDQYDKLQTSMQEIKDSLRNNEKSAVKKEATVKNLEGRLDRLDKIIYGIVGTTGLFVVKAILEGIF